MLSRLELRFGRIMALMGLGTTILGGDAGGETAAIVSNGNGDAACCRWCVRAVAILFRVFPRGRIDYWCCAGKKIDWVVVVGCMCVVLGDGRDLASLCKSMQTPRERGPCVSAQQLVRMEDYAVSQQ